MVHVGAMCMRFSSPEEAEKAATRYSRCPKVHFWGNRGEEATIILKVPEGRRFWSDYILDHPAETFGGLEASLTYMDKVYAPRLIEVGYEKVEGDTSPCGSVCRKCTSLGRCGGCPALSLE